MNRLALLLAGQYLLPLAPGLDAGKALALTRTEKHRTLADLLRRLKPVPRGCGPPCATACLAGDLPTSITSPCDDSCA